jgi:hypothetical protein
LGDGFGVPVLLRAYRSFQSPPPDEHGNAPVAVEFVKRSLNAFESFFGNGHVVRIFESEQIALLKDRAERDCGGGAELIRLGGVACNLQQGIAERVIHNNEVARKIGGYEAVIRFGVAIGQDFEE